MLSQQAEWTLREEEDAAPDLCQHLGWDWSWKEGKEGRMRVRRT